MISVSDYQRDVLGELINIGVGRAAGVLNQMIDSHVELLVPEVVFFDSIQDLLGKNIFEPDETVSAIKLDFHGFFSGVAALVFPPSSACNLVQALVGHCPATDDMDSLRIGALQEIGNIVLNGVMGSMGNMLNRHINYSPPVYFEETFHDLVRSGLDQGERMVLFVRTHFRMEGREISGDILLFFKVETFAALLEAIDAMSDWTC
ncbi:MAG: chemotaxis protein CheC [Deltaproteobacteria bacterium]|nr:chemotaxis protein CheC [Deltaproteobacteria bacterium]